MGIFDWLFAKSNVVGKSASNGTAGVYGGNDADGIGVVGETHGMGDGVFGQSAQGIGVVGRAWAFGQTGVWGFYTDGTDRPQRGASFSQSVTAGVIGTTAKKGDVPSDDSREHHLKPAAGVVGEASLPGDGFGYGVLGLGYKDEGVVGWSEFGAGGSFAGATYGAVTSSGKGTGILAKSTNGYGGQFESTQQAQIRLVPRKVGITAGDQGTSHPKLPRSANSGEIVAVSESVIDCGLWLCVRASRPPIGALPAMDALWAPVNLGPAIKGEA
ncbi:hypothetical protein [Streptomyces sp. NPDC059708]|uniref:hypothetical protein n=1 Tax=Streptomyces sp. NPDC059708 TaxID=3346916 RepID=UPI0036CEEAFF